jgi:hypothetical protein
MTSGDIATYVIAAIILVVFGIGARKIYRNFFRGESECCGSDSCSSCSSCSSGHAKKS